VPDLRLHPEIVRISVPLPAPPPPAVSPALKALFAPWMAVKRATLRPRLAKPVYERVLGRPFAVWPGVFNPVIFRTGEFLADFIATSPLLAPASPDSTALDVGTGCGVLAVAAALRGHRTAAIDVVAETVACATANAALNKVEVAVLLGDLFAPVSGRTFDVILFSLPKFRGKPKSTFEITWRSPDIIDRLCAGLPAMLAPGGRAFFVLTNHGDCEGMLNGLAENGLSVERVMWRHFGNETLAVYSAALPVKREISAAGSI
jgi:SAM-dependent methyltransferase